MSTIRNILALLISIFILNIPTKAEAQEENNFSSCLEYNNSCCLLFSLDFTAGYGRIAPSSEDALIDASIAGSLLEQLLNTNNRSGGFSWRVFGNGLVKFSPYVAIGAELGFSYYPTLKQTQELAVALGTLAIDLQRSIKSTGYGTDLLLDIVFYPLSRLAFSIKPGIQFAYQSNQTNLNLAIPSAPFLFNTEAKYHNTAFLPEIVLSLDALSLNKFCGCKWINSIGLSYQHVFGHNDSPDGKRVNSRDMIGLNLGVLF